ncbi:DUF3006 domain-containing protein [Geomicrobium sp. JCM 19055]|uniref:DUF3006 domain-containing protein n=1 Tax=Geomicrobium sp. JCM 19055 TaxID=1460649 RepID=UPI00045ED9F5|nr:DUF3006 domain-containing protein [Geomicrobium sp. JCM 19055]GAJ99748.1 hypothetical protein JCM19055_2778 [Geomicrobium sp. JCM 19055]
MITERAVLDRIEDGIAVLLVGKNEQEYHVKENELPQGASDGVVLDVQITNDQIVDIAINHEETADQKARISAKMNQLKKKKRWKVLIKKDRQI